MVTYLVFMWEKANIFCLVLLNRLRFLRGGKQEMSMLVIAARSGNQTGTFQMRSPAMKPHVDLAYALLNFLKS